MKDLRIIHTADWHSDSDPVKSKKLEESLKQMVEFCEHNEVNAIIHAGDVWERNQNYDSKSGVPMIQKYLRRLSGLVQHIFIVKGNNSHDAPGSIDLLHRLDLNIYATEDFNVCGIRGTEIVELKNEKNLSFSRYNDYDYIITLMPYPTKGGLMANLYDLSITSIDNNNAAFLEKFEEIFELVGTITERFDCPKILTFHGNVVGSRLSSGQSLVSQDIMVAPSTLLKAKADYYALGHIHLRQEVAENMIYSGSIYNKSWGEIEQKSFEVIDIDTEHPDDPSFHQITVNHYPYLFYNARPMVSLNAIYTAENGLQIEDGIDIQDLDEFKQYRLKIRVSEADRKLISEDDIQYWKDLAGEDLKIDFNIVPVERESRSEMIMNCKGLTDEVKEYAAVINETVTPGLLEKVSFLEERTAAL